MLCSHWRKLTNKFFGRFHQEKEAGNGPFLRSASLFVSFINYPSLGPSSVTRLGDFLDFGPLFKAFGSN